MSDDLQLIREEYAKERLRLKDEEEILFLDEKLFNFYPQNEKVIVKYKKGERYKKSNINFTKPRSSSKSVNCVCWIGSKGLGGIYLAENMELFDTEGNKLNNKKYKGFDNKSYLYLLEHYMIPDMKRMYGSNFKLMMDNSPVHTKMNETKTEQLVDTLLKKLKVERLVAPVRSPDLNPVEEVHVIVQKNL